MPERYPLSWPDRWPRTPAGQRGRAQFGKTESRFDAGTGTHRYAGKTALSIGDAIRRIGDELERNGVAEETVIISTNLPTNLTGIPRGDRGEPGDPGVAVYWARKGKKQAMAIDRYTRVADNLAAVAATLEAFRAIARHGGGEILERSFAGFAQLPASIVTPRPWRDVLEFRAEQIVDASLVRKHYRRLAQLFHSDVAGGSHDRMVELNLARDAAIEELGG